MGEEMGQECQKKAQKALCISDTSLFAFRTWSICNADPQPPTHPHTAEDYVEEEQVEAMHRRMYYLKVEQPQSLLSGTSFADGIAAFFFSSRGNDRTQRPCGSF